MSFIGIGTAGWTVPRDVAAQFPAQGSGLERYAGRFSAVEINSSFHRPHRQSTWARWHDSTPAGFRFAAKLPKVITHQLKLVDFMEPLDAFLSECAGLREKLAVVLVQLPPKLEFDAGVARTFFSALKSRTGTAIACEPRHPSWFEPEAAQLMQDWKIARVAADPTVCEGADVPGAWGGLRYWRLHGSPVKYRSSYCDRIADYARLIAAEAARGREVWCIFDNTASSAAAGDALDLLNRLRQ